MKEKLGLVVYFVLLAISFVFSLLNEIGITVSTSMGFLYTVYVFIVVFTFVFNPLKLSYINDLKISYNKKLLVNFVTNIGEFIPIYFIIINSTALYAEGKTEIALSKAAAILGLLFFGFIYCILSFEDAKGNFNEA
ncbi:MAG: hypothetical protein RR494_13600 [Vagococcus sp.]|uniref:hypothetical protein n=1 Tax=Vagococcus TaxID=2737 RepID=UPI002FC90DCD